MSEYSDLPLFRFKNDQFVPFCINLADFHAKGDSLFISLQSTHSNKKGTKDAQRVT